MQSAFHSDSYFHVHKISNSRKENHMDPPYHVIYNSRTVSYCHKLAANDTSVPPATIFELPPLRGGSISSLPPATSCSAGKPAWGKEDQMRGKVGAQKELGARKRTDSLIQWQSLISSYLVLITSFQNLPAPLFPF